MRNLILTILFAALCAAGLAVSAQDAAPLQAAANQAQAAVADAAKADDETDYGSFVLLNDNPTFFSKDDGGYYDISPDAEYLDADGNAISAEDFSAGERVEASLLSEDSDGTELVVKIKKMK